MFSIPPHSFGNVGLDAHAIPFEDGIASLVDNVGTANMINVVDGMLFYNGSILLPQAQSDEERLILAVRAQVLRDIKGQLTQILSEKEA